MINIKQDKSIGYQLLIEKGGPGSGSWNGPGSPRFAHEGGESAQENVTIDPSKIVISSNFSSRLLAAAKSGGFTVNMETKKSATEGYSVGIHEKQSGVFDAKTVTAKDLQNWLNDRKSLFIDQSIKVGGWNENGKIWLDVVKIFPKTSQLEKAKQIGRDHNQIAIADLWAITRGDWDNAIIPTGGTGKSVSILRKIEKPVFFLFDNDVTGEEIYNVLHK